MLQKMKVIQIVYAQGKCDLFNKVRAVNTSPDWLVEFTARLVAPQIVATSASD